MKHRPKPARDHDRLVGVVEIDAATVARWRRKARHAVRVVPGPHDAWLPEEAGEALALARDLLKVLDGKPERKR